ncbi:MAG: hypothetical protein A2842_01630 [Candidatus Wildermuthbacteria bacterium RIFCSPHIGHO2_01_FULL_48_25]|uniref:DUF1508 domain-containing protein n=1 Tax=Candidatus Wildermuthbacteria bacterium RIFCSPLOWO2_01_FULL_48_16 TaxID=1802461 RepID=A0A1G2RLX1_9BACT|nr:MAG: hypothetical protein A2842_01630 [Candidatus Wildermuthbacteria bacterium RIFCSPHIGHO2_01_FULL_48_25]OHA73488.1 MAG: hypothetical protein A3B24_03180 [Candidatus Wildermuthbacteria bacterium RIFCSPLOWO2_01_FULL_48_16]
MGPKFEVYMDIAGGYRWRLKARNGEIVAISESYVSKYGATRSAELVRSLAGIAMIVDITR